MLDVASQRCKIIDVKLGDKKKNNDKKKITIYIHTQISAE